MTVQIDHGRIDIERIRQQIELDSKRHDAEMKRLDEEIARAKQLYNVEIWKLIVAATAAAGVVGGVIGHLIR